MFKKASIFLIIIFSHFAFAGVSGTPNPNAKTEEYIFSYQISAKNDYTLVNIDNYKVVSGNIIGNLVIGEASGPLVTKGNSFENKCAVFGKIMPFESQLESYCVLAKGDSKIFLTSIRTKGSTDSGEKNIGSNTIIGGTGEYTKIKGRCNYEVEYKENSELIVNGNCNYTN